MGTMAAPPFKVGIHGTGNTSRVFFMRSSPSWAQSQIGSLHGYEIADSRC